MGENGLVWRDQEVADYLRADEWIWGFRQTLPQGCS